MASLMGGGDLFVGVTSWNSETFLGTCLDAVRRNTDARRTRLVVLDNYSIDGSAEIARSFGARVVRRRSGQSMTVGDLFNFSRAEFSLLLHSDVVLLTPSWFEACTRQLIGPTALVSPEDIGCGPYTHPWGVGMPESSFLFFRTALARQTRITLFRRRFRLRLPVRTLDLTGDHLTYNLPARLAERGLGWKAMSVHTSEHVPEPIYVPHFDAPLWKPELAHYRYGLGNFYSVDGVVTHYHNWFERALQNVEDDSQSTLPLSSGGLPLAFLKRYSENFLNDYRNGRLAIPRHPPEIPSSRS